MDNKPLSEMTLPEIGQEAEGHLDLASALLRTIEQLPEEPKHIATLRLGLFDEPAREIDDVAAKTGDSIESVLAIEEAARKIITSDEKLASALFIAREM
jgi:hypothetical protein